MELKNILLSIDCIKNKVQIALSKERFLHTLSVVEFSSTYANQYECDIEKVQMAAWVHDLGKSLSIQKQEELLRNNGYPEDYIKHETIIHAACSKILAKEWFQITDQDVLSAIKNHTCGRPKMSSLEKLIFVCDAVEPTRDYQGVSEIRKALNRNIDEAVYLCLRSIVDYNTKIKNEIYKDTLDAYRYYKEQLYNLG